MPVGPVLMQVNSVIDTVKTEVFFIIGPWVRKVRDNSREIHIFKTDKIVFKASNLLIQFTQFYCLNILYLI